jgi:GNAT superfamily N-acetyltransferase
VAGAEVVRERTEADLDRCVALAFAVHELDGYPLYLPTDLRTFLVSPDAYGAWVAERGGEIVGHVALHRRSMDGVMAMASEALHQPEDSLAVVARLLVAPTGRRGGVGRALLDVASAAAIARGLWPVLDVSTAFEGAMRLYESCGWTRAGEVTVRFPNGVTITEHVYLGPRANPPALTPDS